MLEVRVNAEYLSSDDLLKFSEAPSQKREYKENGQQIITDVVIYMHRSHRASFCKDNARHEQINE